MRSSRGQVFRAEIIFLAITIKFCSIIAVSQIHYTEEKVNNCTYLVTIDTTCTKGVDTSDHVSLRFGDAESNEILVHRLNSKHARRVDPLEPEVLDDVPRKPFQACMVDQFRVTGRCVESPICYLYLKLAGDDDWRPGFALVLVAGSHGSHLSSKSFFFRRYLPRGLWHGSDVCGPEMTPFGLRYRRKIFAEKPHK